MDPYQERNYYGDKMFELGALNDITYKVIVKVEYIILLK